MDAPLKTRLRRAAHGSDLRRSSLDLIVRGLMPLLNRLPDEFFTQDSVSRARTLDRLVDDGKLKRLAQDWFISGTYAGISSGLYAFSRELGFCPLVVVQSAAPIGERQREDFHRTLADRYAGAFILFQTAPGIGGGVRIFANGELVESTWQGRLRTLISRLNQYSYV